MESIKRSDINEQWAHSGIVEAGDFAFISYCVGNIGQSIENQINGAIDHLKSRLESIGLTLESTDGICPCRRTRRAFVPT
jgi:enamine deaminase RidA (YjgF/YER057c/UK114 family)